MKGEGIAEVFGIPGDYNFTLLDALEQMILVGGQPAAEAHRESAAQIAALLETPQYRASPGENARTAPFPQASAGDGAVPFFCVHTESSADTRLPSRSPIRTLSPGRTFARGTQVSSSVSRTTVEPNSK